MKVRTVSYGVQLGSDHVKRYKVEFKTFWLWWIVERNIKSLKYAEMIAENWMKIGAIPTETVKEYKS